MVDILEEVGDFEARKRKPFSVLLVVCIVVAGLSAVSIWVLFGGPDPPIGRELSNVSGAGIVRRGRLQTTKVANNQINASGSSKIYRDGFGLIYALCDATDQQVPLVQKAKLPEGRYRVSALTSVGGRQTLLDMLSTAYSNAFEVNVSQREVEIDVYVMTCPDPSALGLKRTSNRAEIFEGDFRQAPGNSADVENMWFDCQFTADMAHLADYAGYIIRKSWEPQKPDARDKAIATVVVDETGLDGYYTGKLSWRFYVPGALIKELSEKGLKFTRSRRKVKALVIE